MNKQLGFLGLVLILLSFSQTSESILYEWNGSCQLWTPYASNICWNPPGIPRFEDTIVVPSGKNLTLYCPSTFSGSSNSFHMSTFRYGPSCVYEIANFIVSKNGTFQVSTYLDTIITLPSYIEEGGNATLWGSLAAIDGPGDLHVAGNLSVSGGNLQGNGSLIIEGTGLVTFDIYEYEPLDCYLLRTNVIVNGTLEFNSPTMIGFWWQDVTGPYNITILGSVYFNNVYVFNMAEATGGVNFNIVEGGALYSDSGLASTDIVYNTLLNYGNLTTYFPVFEIENYGSISYSGNWRYYECSNTINYANISDLQCGTILNFGNLNYLSSGYNVTNYGYIDGGYTEYLYNYGNANLYSATFVENYKSIEISSVYKLTNQGVINYCLNADYIYNYGLLKTEQVSSYYNMGSTYNFDIIYLTQDSSTLYIHDEKGIIYTDLANFEFQPAYWFWKKGYPQSLYPEVPPYGPEFNRPVLKGYWYQMTFNGTSLSGTGSFQLNVPVNIFDYVFIDGALNIDVEAANYTDPYKEEFSFQVAGNITVSEDGLITAAANLFSLTYPFYFHVFGVVDMRFVLTNLTLVIHPHGTINVPVFLHVMDSISPSTSINNTVEVFGALTVDGLLTSVANIILYSEGVITLQKNSVLKLDNGAVIENCGGKLVNNGGTLYGKVVPCSSFDDFYAPFIDAVEFVAARKNEIKQRFASYDLTYHHL